jgi:hypothetical protein
VPGSTATQPSANNDLGEITGWWFDSNSIAHGFLRGYDDVIVTFDPPGAGSGGSFPTGINNRGDIVGYFVDDQGATHGFVRSTRGEFTVIDDPDANTSPASTQAFAINDAGAIVGSYNDTVTAHGFLREPDGNFVTINAPGAEMNGCLDINELGEVVQSGSVSGRGQLRYAGGNEVTYDAPGAGTAGTYPGSNAGNYQSLINIWGDVVGNYVDAMGAWHGYVRHASGSFTEFLVAGTGTASYTGTIPFSINWVGTVIGITVSVPATFGPAFVRFSDGAIVLFEAPAAAQAGTVPVSINSLSGITGYWLDANFVEHGFAAEAVCW